jgi:dienelactone hydrolase
MGSRPRWILALIILSWLRPAAAEVNAMVKTGGLPAQDARAGSIRRLDTRWTPLTFGSLEAWEARAKQLREQILASAGLLPMPKKTPLNARVFGRIERNGYTVEKAYFESHPGFFVCGNLYRPAGKKGPFPGVLCPHGHWKYGRLQDGEDGSVPGRCISLARQGCVAFSYDMVGYNDSKQVPHAFGGEREQLWGISLMGLQLWDSIRAVDFLRSLPDVDADRIGCTGASGGGTQTFLLTAVDDRVKVSAPVCMVSASYQGGCTCENGPSLRLDVSNVEIAALAAPRPLLLVSASLDWTANTPRVEYPAISSIYELFGEQDRVANAHFKAGHNYNRASREAAYSWFGRWLLGSSSSKPVEEEPFGVEPLRDLLVFYGREYPRGAVDANGLKKYLAGQPGPRTGRACSGFAASTGRRFAAPWRRKCRLPGALSPSRVSPWPRPASRCGAWPSGGPGRATAYPPFCSGPTQRRAGRPRCSWFTGRGRRR